MIRFNGKKITTILLFISTSALTACVDDIFTDAPPPQPNTMTSTTINGHEPVINTKHNMVKKAKSEASSPALDHPMQTPVTVQPAQSNPPIAPPVSNI